MPQLIHILIVDDEPEVLKLFSRILKRGDKYAVTAVDSGSAAEIILAKQHVDLLILDLNMPQQDGLQILKKLRAEKPGLRVLVVSGYLDGAFLKAAEVLGATASLNKAEAPKALLKTVESLLQ